MPVVRHSRAKASRREAVLQQNGVVTITASVEVDCYAVFVRHLGGIDLRGFERSLGYTALAVSTERRPNDDENQKNIGRGRFFRVLTSFEAVPRAPRCAHPKSQ
jgi:hypothetical protein